MTRTFAQALAVLHAERREERAATTIETFGQRAARVRLDENGRMPTFADLRQVLGAVAAERATYDFDPHQLRIPAGNGQISGRWLDDPFTVLSRMLNDLGGSDVVAGQAASAAENRNLVPADDVAKKAFREQHGRAIPPAWKNVQVDLNPDADLVAMGQDAQGRWQRWYSAKHEQRQAAIKYDRVRQVIDSVPKLEEGFSTLDGPDAGEKAAARLMYQTGMRVGSSTQQRGKKMSYGAATLLARHAEVNEDGSVTLRFTAKEGIPAEYTITDPALTQYITGRLANGLDPDESLFGTSSDKVQSWLKKTSGLPGFKNHDLRTMLANRIAVSVLAGLNIEPPIDAKEMKRIRDLVAKKVSAVLRNKPQQALSSYIAAPLFDLVMTQVLDEVAEVAESDAVAAAGRRDALSTDALAAESPQVDLTAVLSGDGLARFKRAWEGVEFVGDLKDVTAQSDLTRATPVDEDDSDPDAQWRDDQAPADEPPFSALARVLPSLEGLQPGTDEFFDATADAVDLLEAVLARETEADRAERIEAVIDHLESLNRVKWAPPSTV